MSNRDFGVEIDAPKPISDAASFLAQGSNLGQDTAEMADSIQRMSDRASMRLLDTNESLVIAQALEALIPRVVENPPLPLNGLQTFNLSSIPEWSETYKWSEISTAGRMEPISDTGADNLPDVMAGAREREGRVATYGMQVSWSFQDLVRAVRMVQPINEVKLMAARRIHDETLNHLIWNGNTSLGLKGLLNNSEIPEQEASAALSGLSGATLVDAILTYIENIDNDTETVEKPNLLLLPPATYNLLVRSRQGTDNTMSLLSEVREKAAEMTEMPGFQIRKVRELKSTNNDRNADLMVLLNNSPEVVQYHAAMLFRQFPIQQMGLRFRIPIMMRPGGLAFYRPEACRIVRGI